MGYVQAQAMRMWQGIKAFNEHGFRPTKNDNVEPNVGDQRQVGGGNLPQLPGDIQQQDIDNKISKLNKEIKELESKIARNETIMKGLMSQYNDLTDDNYLQLARNDKKELNAILNDKVVKLFESGEIYKEINKEILDKFTFEELNDYKIQKEREYLIKERAELDTENSKYLNRLQIFKEEINKIYGEDASSRLKNKGENLSGVKYCV